ncbi:MAG: hypothetical protein AAF827_15990 [Cyanobacteria bacterium P01_D01_bin.6]
MLQSAGLQLQSQCLKTVDAKTREKRGMSLIYGLVLITIAWLLSALVDSFNDIGAVILSLPLWLTVIVVSSAIAWLVSDP